MRDRRGAPGKREWRFGLFHFAAVLPAAFLLGLWFVSLAGRIPLWVPAAYLAMSFATLGFYGWDKRRAKRNEWRTPESTLQLLALLGGWPGALFAQRLIRHKNRKVSFQVVFWLIVAIHAGLWAWLATR